MHDTLPFSLLPIPPAYDLLQQTAGSSTLRLRGLDRDNDDVIQTSCDLDKSRDTVRNDVTSPRAARDVTGIPRVV